MRDRKSHNAEKMKLAWLVIFSLLAFNFSTIRAQLYDNLLTSSIPPSPEAAALNQYLEYPVTNNTGIPSISIPIYELKTRSLTVPISISYHSDGRNMNDESGAVGIGWTLNAGGMVSRTIYGMPDDKYDFPDYLKTTSEIGSPSDDFLFLAGANHSNDLNVLGQFYDTQYDRFSYFFPGGNGRFILDDSVKTDVTLIPYTENIKIGINRSTTIPYPITDFEIIGSNGTRFIFGNDGYVGTLNGGANQFGGITEWYLTEIISADGSESITFEYEEFYKNPQGVSENYLVDFNRTQEGSIIGQASVYNYSGIKSHSDNFIQYRIYRLKEINSDFGTVKFLYQTNADIIESIEIYNDNSVDPIQTVKLTITDLPDQIASFYAKKLDAISFIDAGDQSVLEYTFEYYNKNNVGSGLGDNDFEKQEWDYWGYYNNSGTEHIVPPVEVDEYDWLGDTSPYSPYSNAYFDRDPNPVAAHLGILKKIIYPTGGSKEFIYEGNKYKSSPSGTIKYGPGLRIKKVSNYDNVTQVISTRYYKYGYENEEDGLGRLYYEPQWDHMWQRNRFYDFGSIYWAENYYHDQVTFSSGFNFPYNEILRVPVYYKYISEYSGDLDISSETKGRTRYTYYVDPGYSQVNLVSCQDDIVG